MFTPKIQTRQQLLFLNTKIPFIIWRYIFIDFFFSFLVILVFFIIIFIINQILLLAKNVLQTNVPIFEVAKLLMYALPTVVSLSVPFAALVSCLMSTGGLSTHNEFTAMRMIGMPFITTFAPYIISSVLIMLLSFGVNEILEPWGAINFSKQYQKLLLLSPRLSLKENSIIRYQDNVIITKGINEDIIEGIIILDKDSDNNARTILAKNASISSSVQGVISLTLNDVVSIVNENKVGEYSYVIGEVMTYNLLLKDITFDIRKINADSKSITDLKSELQKINEEIVFPETSKKNILSQKLKMNILDVYNSYIPIYSTRSQESTRKIISTSLNSWDATLTSLRTTPFFNRSYIINKVILNKKIAFPFASILFVFIAFPIGLFYKRSGKTVGFGIGLILSFLYWTMLIIAQSIALSVKEISPPIIMWLPNIFVFSIGILLIIIRRNKL